ncbi:MAG: PorV/PorQ family protein [Elusimicrobiota bacterium]
MKKIVFILLISNFLISLCSAESPTLLSLTINPSARAAGLGEAYSAVAEGIQGLYYNPAGILTNNRPEIGFIHTDASASTEDSEKLYAIDSIGFLYPFKNNKVGFGFLFTDFKVPAIKSYDETGQPLSDNDNIEQKDNFVSFVGSVRLSDRFLFGAILKSISSKFSGSLEFGPDSHDTGAVDTGIMYLNTTRRFTAGLVFANLFGKIKYFSVNESLPMATRIGVAYRFFKEKNLLLSFDINSIKDAGESSPNIGLEWNYNWLSIRTGILPKFDNPTLNLGLWLKLKQAKFFRLLTKRRCLQKNFVLLVKQLLRN